MFYKDHKPSTFDTNFPLFVAQLCGGTIHNKWIPNLSYKLRIAACKILS